ncbi:MAG TPA: right-handed parallel beta-helix repeat-containing protein [bacterium]|nr:right-handed parallel beta-helix repeat-containing protein [bacterium]
MRIATVLSALVLLAAGPRSVAANEVRNADLGTTYSTIQQALDDPALTAGHTVLVLPGDYVDPFTIDVDVTVKSTYETDPGAVDETILRHPGVNQTFSIYAGTLEGFTITGRPAFGDVVGAFVAGTGTLTRCVVRDIQGRGVTAIDSARVLYNVIRGNAPCGAIGSASGAGIWADDDVLIMGNVLEDNYGACDLTCGVPSPAPGGPSEDALRGGGDLVGGGILAFGNVRVVSNLIRRNCARDGAGMYLWKWAVAVNNTILQNKGDGAYVVGDDVTFANNIVAFNRGLGTKVFAAPTIDNNLFWNNDGGDGVTGTDPILAHPLLRPDDVRLRPVSPAIDAGDDSWVLAADLDFDGRPRIAGDRVDVGASEFVGRALQPANGDASGLLLSPPAPSPLRGEGEVSFRFQLPAAGTVILTVHDVLGRRVAVRAPQAFSAGEHRVRWNPGPLAAGYYFVRLSTETGPAATAPWIVLR